MLFEENNLKKNKMYGMYFWNKSAKKVLSVVTLWSSSDRYSL
jgi:hypothetical protein